jgi:hypothetical protein
MTTHSIRYIIEPPSACPVELRSAWGRPKHECDLNTYDVALCAMGEILETAPTSNPFFGVFEELLVPGQRKLIWKGDGPGRGVEMRRAFSGIFGRFFARAYLQRYHGFSWFVPINGAPTDCSSRLRVTRKASARIDLPDWLCAGPGKLAIGEAKGSHQKGNAKRGGLPGPIKTASVQISGALVQTLNKNTNRWNSRSVKGWAIMSRWGVESPPKDAFLYAFDPETSGEPLQEDEITNLVQGVARMHVRQTLEGLGYGDLSQILGGIEPSGPSRQRQTVVLHLNGESGTHFLGAIASRFGFLSLSVSEAQDRMASLPLEISRQLYFVGLDVDVVVRLLHQQPINRRQTREADDGTRIGADGLLVAPLARVSSDTIQI